MSVIEHLERELSAVRRGANEPIAIIGMGCRFPGGAIDPDAYWQSLCNGTDAVSAIPEERWSVEACYDPQRDASGKIYTRFGSFLGDVSGFDADFFGVSPREACALDPQQRLLLEVTWETLEHAAIAPASLRHSQTGVFVGIGQNDYGQLQLNAGELERITRFDGTGNGFCFAPGRISHTLGVRGPSIAVDCACSSSLVAVHLACQSLHARECDLAIAAGVQLILSPEVTVFLCRAGALAADGRCKAFDAAADGFGRGEGCGVVALKRLSDARADGDFVWAIIRGSAVNHDGPSSGLTVPSVRAQAELLSRALASARLEPEAVGYIEAHGTGTQLGDPIEAEALVAIHGRKRSPETPLWLASAKTNHGHLEAAAGIAGLIKTALSLRHNKIPPHLHFRTLNPHIAWDRLAVRIPTGLENWQAEHPRIAGVSAFGFGGTNAHVIIEEGGVAVQPASLHGAQVLLLSARTEAALREMALRYAKHLEQHRDLALSDVCRTAALGRNHFVKRVALVAESRATGCDLLRAFANGEMPLGIWSGPVSSAEENAEESEPEATTLEDAAAAYVQGRSFDLGRWFRKSGRPPVVLPTYPFERQRYWIEKPRRSASRIPVTRDTAVGIYEIHWKQLTERTGWREPPRRSGRWLVLSSADSNGDAIAEELRRAGGLCTDAGIELSTLDTLVADTATKSEQLAGIVHCGGGCDSALRLFQAVRRLNMNRSPPVWLVTENAQVIGAEEEHNLSQAMLWGLGRSLALDWPDLWGGLHDLPGRSGRETIVALVGELLRPSLDQAIWRESSTWVPQLRPRRDGERAGQAGQVELRADGAYWIMGGWGAIGLRVAEWLVSRGAGLIVLSGRREPPATASEFVQRATARGARVWLRRSDCTDADATANCAHEIEAAGYALRGVFHAAGLGGVRRSDELMFSEFERVCRAKVDGARNLHELTRNRELDYFVLFSSIAAVWGSKGQAHYAAANHFLDALAQVRFRAGLPALTVNWGPWAGGGLTDAVAQAALERLGISVLQPDAALRALETLLLSKAAPQAVAVNADWDRFTSVFDGLPRQQFFDEIASVEPSEKKRGEKMCARPELQQRVPEIVAELLGYPAGRKLNAQAGFRDLGMDSVMAVELRRRLEQEFGVALSATLAFDHPNLTRLLDHLDATLFPAATPARGIARLPLIPGERSIECLIEERLGELESLLRGTSNGNEFSRA